MTQERPVAGCLVERRAVPPLEKNGYLLIRENDGRGLYIDPGDEAGELLAWLDRRGGAVAAILNTHAHFDHVCGNLVVKERWDVPIYVHEADRWLYASMVEQAAWFGFHYSPPPPVDHWISGEPTLRLLDREIQVLHTPGHSPGSVCYLADRALFCGDVVFAGSIGRTDLPGGSGETLLASIRGKILPLADDVILYPGHGPATTVGRERLMNPFLNGELNPF